METPTTPSSGSVTQRTNASASPRSSLVRQRLKVDHNLMTADAVHDSEIVVALHLERERQANTVRRAG